MREVTTMNGWKLATWKNKTKKRQPNIIKKLSNVQIIHLEVNFFKDFILLSKNYINKEFWNELYSWFFFYKLFLFIIIICTHLYVQFNLTCAAPRSMFLLCGSSAPLGTCPRCLSPRTCRCTSRLYCYWLLWGQPGHSPHRPALVHLALGGCTSG